MLLLDIDIIFQLESTLIFVGLPLTTHHSPAPYYHKHVSCVSQTFNLDSASVQLYKLHQYCQLDFFWATSVQYAFCILFCYFIAIYINFISV